MNETFAQQRKLFKLQTKQFWLLLILLGALCPYVAEAQVIPDGTLPNNSIVTPEGNLIRIEGGSQAGSNLFHSFAEFSVPAGTEAFFNNSLGIENIITRVTGDNISNIDGIIRANGGANLFLLNPNGIFFGDSARLALGGSFFGSTAESLQFGDGLEFNANAGTAGQPPLLSINVPMGLQFGSLPGSIRVRGNFRDTFEVPTRVSNESEATDILTTVTLNSLSRPANLAVASGETFALVGGEIVVEGAQLSAPEGRIALGSVGSGSFVGIAPTGDLTYDRAIDFRDIHLNSSATVNASGDGGGSLQLRGRHISLTDDSVAIALNVGDSKNAFSSIEILADELTLQGESFLASLALGNGAAGDATLRVGTLALNDRSFVGTATLGAGDAGGIAISAAEEISINNISAITTSSFSSGAGGLLEIETRRLTLGDTGLVSTSTLGLGTGGDLNIYASESIALNPGPVAGAASEDRALFANGLFSTTDSSGNAGNILITTDKLTINARDTDIPIVQASIFSTTSSEGKAGAITIRANFLEAIGSPVVGRGLAQISSGGGASGSAGSVTLVAEEVAFRDGAQLLVSNSGSGDAGTLSVIADRLTLEDGGTISASTVTGQGGSIVLETDTLLLRRGGRIATDAGNSDGGNITIDTDVLAALANSDITANAEAGFGGRVSIASAGIFGTQFRQQVTPQSDITATSNLGADFSGVVAIDTPDVNPTAGLLQLPENLRDSSEAIAPGCEAYSGSEFYIVGRGGLPTSPHDPFGADLVEIDLIEPARGSEILQNYTSQNYTSQNYTSQNYTSQNYTSQNYTSGDRLPKSNGITEIIEATGWIVNADGSVELVARPNDSEQNPWWRPADCGDLQAEG